MNRELELTVRAEDAQDFVGMLSSWRTGQALTAEEYEPGAIRDEHERRVEAADRLIRAVRDQDPGEALTLTARDRYERFVLAMVVDRVLSFVVEEIGDVAVEDYDALEAGAEDLTYWVGVARDFNAGCDQLDAAELEGGR